MDVLDIIELMKEKKYKEIRKILITMNEVDIAEILNGLNTHDALLLFRLLPKDMAVEVFANINPTKQRKILTAISDEEINDIVEDLFFDDMIDIIEEMPAHIVRKILNFAKEEERKLVNQFLNYPEESAGSLMTIEYVELREHMTVGESMHLIKDAGIKKETIYNCYVTDEHRVLKGVITLKKLVTSDEKIVVGDIMEKDVIKVNTHSDQEKVANIFRRYGFIALPVVDNENRLTGIITVDDVMRVIEQEATEDFQVMAAMTPTEEEYINASVWDLAKNRLPWLLFLMVSATFTGRIMGRYEDILTSVAILGTFVPMLMDTGGNSGSQSSTLIIRGLATGDISVNDGMKIIWKEFRISLTVGFILALTNFLRLMMLEQVGFTIALTVSVTLVVTVVLSKIVGGILPIIAKKFKLDPAIMAGPLITTIVDALSLVVYFQIAGRIVGL